MKKSLITSLIIFVLSVTPSVFISSTSATDTVPSFLLEWGTYGMGTNEFNYPRSITVDNDGIIYVVDEGDCHMQKFMSDGTYLDEWETCILANRDGLAADSLNNIYVSGSSNARVEKFTSDGEFLFAIGATGGPEEDYFNVWHHQYDVAVDSEDNVYVLDASGREIGNFGVHVFSSDGTFITRWGPFGDAPLRESYEDWELRNPCAIIIDSQDNVYVVDNTRQVKKFTKDGTFITKWGIDEFGQYLFNQPMGLAVDDNDNIYVNDWKAHNIQVFNSNGDFLFKWGSLGSGQGQFNTPYGTAIYGDYVYVADAVNHRIQKFTYGPACTEDTWSCNEWSECSPEGQKTRICSMTYDCPTASTPSPNTSDACTYIPPTCTSWTYSDWSACSTIGQQTRTVISSSPSGCTGGSPTITQSCTPACTEDTWSCGAWGECLSNNTQTRTCSMTNDCATVNTPSPATSQSCTYTPPCTEDIWECGDWSECSPLGVRTRDCIKTYDCPSAETFPVNSETCTPENNNSSALSHENIVKSTVQLLCYRDHKGIIGAGSGTIIDPSGIILTNKHVIMDYNNKDVDGCFVGFTTNIDDYPQFTKIAYIIDKSTYEDIALLKIKDGTDDYSYIDIGQGNSDNLNFDTRVLAYGYPIYNKNPKTVDDLIQKITYSSGDFSGYLTHGYFKTTAMLEHGISGGGAYSSDGIFVGITSAGLVGETNTMGLVLGINNINSWTQSSGASSKFGYDLSNMDASLVFEQMSIDDFCASDDGICEEPETTVDSTSNSISNTEQVVNEERALVVNPDTKLSGRLKGRILLQVEQNGEGWYVNPDNQKKYYLGRPADAFSIMRNLGLGIKHTELKNYLNAKFPSRLSGKIMLDVEQNGEAYYVNPNNLKGYYLNRPADAFRIMRELGLGITNTDIRKIDVGEIN